jgi:hypothetical protein|tara:strand:+ start:679 stop:882 length:204 start_codon:yes stop_codon:yes gene_type:complete
MAVLTPAQRKKSATVIQKKKGRTRYRFPIPDKTHARVALARLPNAKGLTTTERKKIKDKANRMLRKK